MLASRIAVQRIHLNPFLVSKAMAVFDYLREALSEFMATCAFVFLMCGTGLSTRDPNNLADIDLTAHFAVSLANGLAASLVIFAFGNISGAHFNPVVSASLYALGKLSLIRLVMYSAAQFAGGLFGAALLKGVFPAGTGSYPFPNQAGLGHTELTPNVSLANGWMCELLITFTLVFTALRVAVDPVNYVRSEHWLCCISFTHGTQGKFAPLIIGGVVFVNVMIGVTITGGSMNPARSFGPAMVAGVWKDHWIYWGTYALREHVGLFAHGPIPCSRTIHGRSDCHGAVQVPLHDQRGA